MGTNVNRDGAALYEAVSVIFIVQVSSLNLGLWGFWIRIRGNVQPLISVSVDVYSSVVNGIVQNS